MTLGITHPTPKCDLHPPSLLAKAVWSSLSPFLQLCRSCLFLSSHLSSTSSCLQTVPTYHPLPSPFSAFSWKCLEKCPAHYKSSINFIYHNNDDNDGYYQDFASEAQLWFCYSLAPKLLNEVHIFFALWLRSMWDLPTRIESMSPAFGAGILNHWTTREVPEVHIFSQAF